MFPHPKPNYANSCPALPPLRRQELAAAVAAEGLRPTLHPDTPPQVQQLLLASWQREPTLRPSAADVAHHLAALAAEAAAAASSSSNVQRPLSAAAAVLHTPSPQPALCSVDIEVQQAAAAARVVPVKVRAFGDSSGDNMEVDDHAAPAAEPAAAAFPGTFHQHASASGVCHAKASGSARGAAAPAHGLPHWLSSGCDNNSGGKGREGLPGPQARKQARRSASGQVPAGHFLAIGRRDSQEDTVLVLPEDALGVEAPPGCALLGVFDGHRWGWGGGGLRLGSGVVTRILRSTARCELGPQEFEQLLPRHMFSHVAPLALTACRGGSASEYLAGSLQRHLADRLATSASAGELLAGALADADVAYRAQQDAAWRARLARMGESAAGQRPSPGSTATLVLLYPCEALRGGGGGMQQQQHQTRSSSSSSWSLAVAHLGDSRAVLCRDGQVRRLELLLLLPVLVPRLPLLRMPPLLHTPSCSTCLFACTPAGRRRCR